MNNKDTCDSIQYLFGYLMIFAWIPFTGNWNKSIYPLDASPSTYN